MCGFFFVFISLVIDLWCNFVESGLVFIETVEIVLLRYSSDVRKSALLSLIKKAREEQPEVWDEYFNAVLLILLETVTDDDVCQPC